MPADAIMYATLNELHGTTWNQRKQRLTRLSVENILVARIGLSAVRPLGAGEEGGGGACWC